MDKTIYLNSEQFYLRLKYIREYFYSTLNLKGNLGFLMGKHSSKDEMNTDSALFLYLLGYEFPDTFIILNEEKIAVLSGESKQIYIKTIRDCPFTFYMKNNETDMQKLISDFSKDIFIVDGLRNNNNFTNDIIGRFNIRYITANSLFYRKDIYEIDLYKSVLPVIYHKFNRNMLTALEKEYYRTVDLDFESLLDDPTYAIDTDRLDFSEEPIVNNYNDFITYEFPLSFNGYNFTFARTVLLSEGFESDYAELFKIRKEILNNFSAMQKYSDQVELTYSGLLVERIDDYQSINKDSIICIKIFKDNLMISDVVIFNEMDFTRDLISKESVDLYISKGKRPVRRQTEQLAAERRAEISTSRQDHQRQLMDQLIKENIDLLENQGEVKDEEVTEKIILYSSPSQVRRERKIIIDEKYFMINIPLKTFTLPIHISFLKTFSKNENIVRLNFKESEKLKYLSYRTDRPSELFAQLTDLRKKYALHKEMENVHEQEALHKGVLFATSINIKTDARQPKKVSHGRLEIFKNGIQYIASTEKIAILFSNVDRAICNLHKDGELHLILRSPIIFNKKKTYNFQFYRDFGELIIDTGKYISAEEERQKEERLYSCRVNYKEDIKHMLNLLKDKMPVEIAKITGFNGVPFRAQAYIQMTESGLIGFENPFFTLNFKDVELVVFERVIYGLTSFDLIFIFKSKQKVQSIFNIGVENLNYLRSYFDSKNLPFIENTINLKWNVLLKTIRGDLLDFYKQGAWTTMQADEEPEKSSSASELSLPSSSSDDEDSGMTSTDDPVSESDEYSESSYSSESTDDE